MDRRKFGVEAARILLGGAAIQVAKESSGTSHTHMVTFNA